MSIKLTMFAVLAAASLPAQISLGGKIAVQGGQFVANARSYGALGDGSHDDTSAIVAALTAAQSLPSKMLYLPAGNYALTSATNGSVFSTSTTGIEIFGDGEGRTILTLPSTLTPIGNFALWSLAGKNQKIHDMSIVGPSTCGNTNCFNLIAFSGGAFNGEAWNIECSNMNNPTSAGMICVGLYQPYTQPEYSTTLGTAVSSTGTATITPASMTGIAVNSRLNVDTGGNQEYVLVTAVTTATFTASFAKTHLSSAPLAVISRAYQYTSVHDCYVHDSPNGTAFGITSAGNTFRHNRIVNVGSNSTQHGFYAQVGDNLYEDNEIEFQSGYCFQVYNTLSSQDATGSRIVHNKCVNPATGYLAWTNNPTNGTVTEVSSGISLQRYLTLDGNYFFSSPDAHKGGFNVSLPTVLVGNTFENVGYSSAGKVTATGNHFVVSSKVVGNIGWLGAGDGSTVVGNTFSNLSTEVYTSLSVGLNSIFRGNQVTGIHANFMNVFDGDVIDGNVFVGTGGVGMIQSFAAATTANPWIFSHNHITGISNIGEMVGNENGSFVWNTWSGTPSVDHPTRSLLFDSNTGPVNAAITGLSPSAGRLFFIPGTSSTANLMRDKLVTMDSSGNVAPLTTSDTVFAGISQFSCSTPYCLGSYFAGQPGTEYPTLVTDGAWTTGNYGIASTTTAGTIHDTGTGTAPSSGSYVLFLDSGGSAGNAKVRIIKTL